MDFDLSEDQRTIKATARELLAAARRSSACARRRRRGATTTELWRELCELGWPGIAVAEEHGGQGLGAVELAVLLEELGYAVAAVPLLGSALAALAIEHAGDERAARALAARARLGRADRRVRRRARPDRRRARRRRDRLVEAGAPRVVARADADVEPVDAIDPTRRYARVSGDGAGARRRRRGARSAARAPRSPPRSSASASGRST